MTKPLLFHVQHFLGVGHLVRALSIAQALTEDFHVTLVSGGNLPAGLELPADVELLSLPPLSFDSDRLLVSADPGRTVEEVLELRLDRLIEVYDVVDPSVVLVELFPFGRKKLSGELTALFERARSRSRSPLIATSVRDILVTGRSDQQRHDDRASDMASRYVDLVLVHGDRRFAAFDESFRPRRAVRSAFEYTGFVAAAPRPDVVPTEIEPRAVVVSAGGGRFGAALIDACLDAAPLLAQRHGLPMTVIPGPLAEEAAISRLEERVAELASVRLVRAVAGLLPTLRQAGASISQAGYNTTVDLFQANVPSVLVPYRDKGEDEQIRRARRMAECGLAAAVDPASVSGPAIVDALTSQLTRARPSMELNLDGARRSATILRQAEMTMRRKVG